MAFTRTKFPAVQVTPTNSNFNGSSGQGSIRVFIDENPFVSQQAIDTINDLEAQGLNVATQDGSRFISIRRNLSDIYGPVRNSLTTSTRVQGTLGARGDFNWLDRNFFWESAFVYGRIESDQETQQRLDIEFFLALDVVADENGNPVCRQQTLDAPESIAVRNPGLSFVFNENGLVPTQAQIDACVPLNVIGEGNPSQAAIDNIVTFNENTNTTVLIYFSQQFGGDIIDLPAGAATFVLQGEYREESNNLDVDIINELGLSEFANTPPADGTSKFVEFGGEISIPIFGGDFTYPGLKQLEVNAAWRRVRRSSTTSNPLFADVLDSVDSVTDSVWSIKAGWRPIDDLLLRGAYGESVRSPSQTELFGSLQFAFANGNGAFPCTTTSVGQGPNPDVRAANCQTAFDILGIDTAPADFQNINIGETAGVVGNPFLSNEQSQSWNVGFVYTPSYIDGLTIQVDYLAIDLENEVGLQSPFVTLPACFDSPQFPNVDLNGTNPCDQFIFGADDGTGTFIVPADTLNQLTGNPVLVGPQAGAPINGQGPGQIAFSFFSNLNLAATELRQFNINVRYGFDVSDLFGTGNEDWGNVRMSTSMTLPDRFDTFSDGTENTLNQQVGDFISSVNMTNRISYEYQKFRMGVTHVYQRRTFGNIQTDEEDIPEQQNDFRTPGFHLFNADFRYQVTDDLIARLSVNNVFDNNGVNINGENTDAQFVFPTLSAQIGRAYRFSLTYDF